MGTDEPKEQVESIRAVGVGTQAPVYLRKKNEEDAREIGGGGLVSGDGFADHFMERSFPTADPCICLLYTSPSPRDGLLSRMPSSA